MSSRRAAASAGRETEVMPALFTTMSRRPQRVTTADTSSSASAELGEVGRKTERRGAQVGELGHPVPNAVGGGADRDPGPQAPEQARAGEADPSPLPAPATKADLPAEVGERWRGGRHHPKPTVPGR